MSISSTVFAWRCRRAVRVLEIRRHRELVADLADYDTARERADLLALLDQLDDDQTAEVRDILGRPQWHDDRRRRPVAGMVGPRPGW